MRLCAMPSSGSPRRAATAVEYVVIVSCLLLVLIVVVRHVGAVAGRSFDVAAANTAPPSGAFDDLASGPTWASDPATAPNGKKKTRDETEEEEQPANANTPGSG